MGFWDVGIGDLEALGVSVSADQRKVLNEGGEVLIIQHLLSYGATQGDDHGMFDQDGEAVFVPQLLQAIGPLDEPGYLEDWHGTEWRVWPSYIGNMEEASVDQRFWDDCTTYVRVWEGLPILDANDKAVAKRLFRAARSRVSDSVYEQLCTVIEFEANGEYGYELDDLLPLMDFIASNEDADISDLAQFEDCEDVDFLKYVARCMKDLVDGNFISFTNYNITANSPNTVLNDCMFEPMEYYLQGDREAQIVWSRLVNRRENALAIITDALPKPRAYHFDQYERST